ncbi:MAG TPA: hypothetical protein VEH76_00765 [Methylocystis sp.]|nr:hypothetical protein [Methylocystis sp.]
MRHVLAAIFILAIGAPAASALPTIGASSVTAVKASPIEQAAAKRGRTHAQRHSKSRGGAGGIHPLVGSGDY